MIDLKVLLGTVSVILTFAGYVPYIVDIFKGTTKPHMFSWLVWSITTFAVYFLQLGSGAGFGANVTLALALLVSFVFLISIKKGDLAIKKIDSIFLIIALVGVATWLLLDQPVLSIIILTGVDLCGFVPTVRKSWLSPYSETLSFYIITSFRHILNLFALAEYNVVTWFFPLAWSVVNALFALFLIVRRRILNNGSVKLEQ